MSTLAEQVVEQLKTDMDNVYDSGYQKGVSETDGYGVGYSDGQSHFGIPNEVAGTGMVTCDYVNENEHEIEVKLSSDTVTDFSEVEVKVLNNNWYSGGNISGVGIVEVNVETIPPGTYMLSANVASDETTGDGCLVSFMYDEGGIGTVLGNGTRSSKQIILAKNVNRMIFRASNNNANSSDLVFAFTDIQVELKNADGVATDYESYVGKTYTANADGTVDGVTSISPTMLIFCDTDGVNISAKFYRDTSNVLLKQEILFGDHGTMYLKHHVVDKEIIDGFRQYAFEKCVEMETFSAPYARTDSSAVAYVWNQCVMLKEVYLPRFTRGGNYMFNKCNNLEKITFGSEEYPIADIKQHTFGQLSGLKELILFGVISISLNLPFSSLLSDASVQNIIDCLADLTGSDTQTLTVHADVEARMTDEQKATITSKNWTLTVAS